MLIHKINKTKLLIIVILGFFITTILFSTNIKAHSPSDMKIIYNYETKKIDATITHQVPNPEVHYVYKIEVRINDELYKTFNYTSQPGSTFTYSLYEIEANLNDSIEVKALCNQVGQITKQLIVSEKNGESPRNGDSTPGFEILVFIVSLVIVFVLLKNK